MSEEKDHTTLYVVGGITVVVAGIFGYRAIKKGAADRRARKEGRDLDNTVDKDIKNTGKPASVTDTNYKLLANRLYSSLNVWSPDNAQVYQVFAQMNNDRDVLELVKAFGMRMDSSNGIDTDEMASLGSFVQKMGKDGLNALNMMLARKAIKYRF